MDSKEGERLKNYEAQYASYLRSKYFSDKDIYGGKVFEKKVIIDGVTILAGRDCGTKSYDDPLAFWNEKVARTSETQTDTTTNLSNGKHSSKQSSKKSA